MVHRARKVAAQLTAALRIHGPFNLPMLVKHGRVRVIELNLRASRNLPFVSKVTGATFVREAVRRMLGERRPIGNRAIELDYVMVKAPQFSFPRLVGADPMLGVEMARTGEVGCFGNDVDEARIEADELGLPLYATAGSAEAPRADGIPCTALDKLEREVRSGMDVIKEGLVDLVINEPRSYDELGRPEGHQFRGRTVYAQVPLLTDLLIAKPPVGALLVRKGTAPVIRGRGDYLARQPRALA